MRRPVAPFRWNRIAKGAALGLSATVLFTGPLLAGCSSTNKDPLQVTNHLTAAVPAPSPAVTARPAGTVHPLPDRVTDSAITPTTHTLVLTTTAAHLKLVDTTHPANPPRTVPLPGPAAAVHPAADGRSLLAAVPDADEVLRIDSVTGKVQQRLHVRGGPTAAIQDRGRILVTLRDKTLAVLDAHGTEQRRVPGYAGPADVLHAGTEDVVLDRLDSTVSGVDTKSGERTEALRAGNGATNAVSDRFGRILSVDTRGRELMVFSTSPLIMRQRYPLPGSPYGVTYDPHRDLAWVTLPDRNEVVGYNVAAGEPQERYRFPTVRQPNSVAVDPDSGAVYVASAAGEGMQVITP